MIYSIEELKNRVAPVAKKYDLRAVYIFGSYARNEATDSSDIDILVDCEGSKIKSLFHMGGLYNDLCESIGMQVDLVTLKTLEQESTQERAPWFVDNLRRDMVKIYE